MFKHGLYALLVCASLLLQGCQSQFDKSVITFGLQSAPLTLDPHLATDASAERINRLVFRSLVNVNPVSGAEPGLATWKMLSPTHYRFTLKTTNTLFHNGKPLTSFDVRDCYKKILAKEGVSPHRGNLSHIQNIKVIDKRNIDFYLSKNDILFPDRLTVGIPDATDVTVGNGPFKIVNAESLAKVVLQRISDNQRVAFVQVKDSSVRVLKLLRGELDIIQNDLQTELIDYLRQQNTLQVLSSPGTSFSYIGFNMENAVTSSRVLRTAMSLAIDRQKIIDSLLGGRARLSHSLLPRAHWARKETLPAFSYQPDKARMMLKQVFNEQRPRIIFKTTTDPLRLRIVSVIQKQLAEVGIELDIRSYDWGTFYSDIKSGNFQVYSLSWVGINSPDIYQTVFHSQSIPPKGANRGRYRNWRVDQLLDDAFSLSESKQAMIENIEQVQRILLHDLPYIPLWFEDNIAVMSKRIQGYRLSVDGSYDALTDVRFKQPRSEKIL